LRGLFVSLLFLFALARVANAASMVYDVTPQNIADHHMVVRSSFQEADSTVAFNVGIATSIRPEDRVGSLQIWQTRAGVKTIQDRTGRRVHLSGREVGCLVSEQVAQDRVWYSFSLRREIAERATFTITLISGNPGFMAFEIRLGEFWPQ